jgi:hypothetical protein
MPAQGLERPILTACSVEGCPKPPRSKRSGICEKHYARVRRHGVDAEPAFEQRVEPGPCLQCGQGWHTAKFCSQRCQTRSVRGIDEAEVRHCPVCDETIPRSRRADAVFCGDRCSAAVRNGSRGLGALALGKRDGWTCHLCHDPVDPALIWPHPYSGTADHVVPLALGGTNDPENIRLAHAVCNIKKGPRAATLRRLARESE